MSRKRIVVSLLLLVALSLGAACYLQLTRTTGNTVALATPAAPATTTTESAPPVGELEAGEALDLAPIVAKGSAPAVIPVPTAEQATAEDPTLEVSTVTMETVDMPTQSIVLASAADNGAYQPRGTYARQGNFRFSGAGGFGGDGGGGGGGGGGRGGSETPDQQPSDSSNSSESNSPGSEASGSGEPEGQGPAGDTQEGPASDETPPKSDTKDSDDSTPPKDEEQKDTEQPPSVTEPGPDGGSPGGEPPFEGPGDLPEQEPVHVPEPSTLALLGAGLAALGFARRRRTPQ